MKQTVVLYPAPAFGQLVSMVELAKLILRHHPYFCITILVPTMPFDTFPISPYINQISQTNIPISFHSLPPLLHSPKAQSQFVIATEFIRFSVPDVLHALRSISNTFTIVALITSAVHAPYDPSIPTYYYYTSCASSLAAFLYLPTLQTQTTQSLRDLKSTTLLHFPGLPPIKASHLPDPIFDQDEQGCLELLNFAACLPKSNGIIVNTFDSLEPRAIKAIANGICVPNGATPPVYCIGPLTANANDRLHASPTPNVECLLWLNKQPERSVVFLCFGSAGAFSGAQMKEIGIGLERSNQRFLWVVRNKTPSNLESLLVEGFFERTKERGLVVNSWAPQADVLSHQSVGGFVTHCGWNSVLEAVREGVPMVAWPMYIEQRLNAVVLVEEMKLALDETSSSDGELVRGEEVEMVVRELMMMSSAKGEALRKRSAEMKAMASDAWRFGGSSLGAFSKLVDSWKQS